MAADAPTPVAEGALSKTPLAQVLANVALRRMDGTLAVWPDPGDTRRGQDRVRFEQGIAVALRPLEPVASLDRGLAALFGRRAAPYAFYTEDLVGRGEPVLEGRIDPLALLARALRGPAAASHAQAMDSVLERLGRAPLALQPEAPIARLMLDGGEQEVLAQLSRAAVPASQLVAGSIDPDVARRVLYVLALVRGLHVRASDPVPVARPEIPSERPRIASERPRRSSRAPAPPPEAPPPPPHLAPDMAQRWREMADRASQLEGETFFQMLGVQPADGDDAVSRAYLEQVKRWHPDRLPSELEPLRPWVERVFRYVTEARDTLSDPEQRERYLQALKGGGGTPEADRRVSAIVGAAFEFQKVEVLARRRHWDEALQVLDEALALNPDEADFHAMRAWLMLQKAGGDAQQAEIRTSADRALALDPRCVRAHYTKGLVLKQMGEPLAALEHFRTAAEIDPRHIEAAREVRSADMRERKHSLDPPSGRPSLFDKLFGGTKK
jgi:curved DNA-binding protein CbpA